MTDQPVLPPNKIAFVIDGEVVDVFHTDDRLAAVLLSNPLIVDVSSTYEGKDSTFHIVGWKYDSANGTLTAAEIETITEPTNG